MNKTPIQWTDETWNPVLGCRRISPGCQHCYAERLIATRMSKNPKLPMYRDIARLTVGGDPQFTGVRRLLPGRLDGPIRARKGRRIFVCDMGDLFFEGHPFEDIAAVFGVMAAAPQHTFQVLTKRPKRMREFFEGHDPKTAVKSVVASAVMRGVSSVHSVHLFHDGGAWPLPNVWLGVSAEDQQRADERHEHLRACPAAVRFYSVEPMLGPIPQLPLDGIAWVIIGGESGPRARPFDPMWGLDVIEQCRVVGVAPFMKQYGSNPTIEGPSLRDSHGGDPAEWPADLRVREIPGVSS